MAQLHPSGRIGASRLHHGTAAVDPVDVARPGRQETVGHTDVDDVAGAVVHLTKSLLPEGAEASVVVLRGTEVHTVAATSAVARVLDAWQHRTGQGPCLLAARSGATVYAADLRVETRWPRWIPHGVDVGARSVLSFGLGSDDTVTGGLNIYSTQPHAFDRQTSGIPQTLAACATAALKIIDRYEAQAAHVQHLQAAMVNRAVIEQAKGIIMGERRCTADEAFAILTKISQDSNRKVRDIAAALTDRAPNTPRPVGEPPTTPPRRVRAAATARHLHKAAPAPVIEGTSPGSPPNDAATHVQVTTDVDQNGVAIIRVVGELVMDTIHELLAAITAALATPATRLVVDLARVPLLDMAALGALLQGRAVALRAGASFRAVRPQPPVRHVLHLTDTCLLLTVGSSAGEPGDHRLASVE